MIRSNQLFNFKVFSNLQILSFILNSLRKAVLTLESRSATLADYFLCLIKLAAVLKNLLRSVNSAFCNYCAKVINKRCEEFNDNKYITCFFLDPQFRNASLKKCAFKRILTCAALIRKKQDFDHYECKILCNQIIKYKD